MPAVVIPGFNLQFLIPRCIVIGKLIIEIEPEFRTFPAGSINGIAFHGITIVCADGLPVKIGKGRIAFYKCADAPVALVGLECPRMETEISLVPALMERDRKTALHGDGSGV